MKTFKESSAAKPDFLQRWWNQQLRIGKTAPARLRWVVEFAQRDLTALTSGEWTDLLSALATFIAFPFPPLAHHHPPRFIYSKGRVRLTQDEGREVQHAYRHFITTLVNKQRATTGELRVTVGAWFIPDLHHPGQTLVGVTYNAHNLVTDAMWGLFGLLAAHGLLLRQCPERTCHRIFVAARTNQAYCSTQCLSRNKTREYRKRKEEGRR